MSAERPRIRVLLLEDDPDDQLLVRMALADITGQRFELECRSDYETGWDLLAQRRHDVYLVDLHLGAHNGLELIRAAVASGVSAPLILLTGHDAREVDLAAMQAGAADYLPKAGLNGSSLERAIRHALDRTRSLQEMARLVAIIEQTADSIIVTDTAGAIQYVNPEFEKLTGYSRAEVQGRNPRLLKSNQTPPEAYRQMWTNLRAGRPWSGHFTNRKKDGALHEVRATISPIRDVTGQVVSYVGVSRDLTHERLLEAQLRQSQKTEAVGRLAGGIAHDFNNLLTVITGYTALALREPELPDRVRDRLGAIQQATDRAAELTRQLLAYSRRQTLHFKTVNLNEVVAALEPMLRRVISEDIELRVNFAPALGAVRADVAQLEQVLLNLVINARDAMPRGGLLSIETAQFHVAEPLADSEGGLAPGQYARLAVTDTGVGMTDEVKAHLFEPFFTTKGPGKGTGLGLATCYGIIEQSGGHIRAYSEVGHGTVFKIYLPLVDAPVEKTAAVAETAQPLQGQGSILLVEDEPAVRELAACVLREAGYAVIEAGHGREALELVQAEPERVIDLVISDLVMPQLDGQQMMNCLRQLRPALPVLFVSGYTHDVLAQRAVLDHNQDFLEKPFSPSRLLWKARQALERAAGAAPVSS